MFDLFFFGSSSLLLTERLEVGSDPDRIAALAAAQKVYLKANFLG